MPGSCAGNTIHCLLALLNGLAIKAHAAKFASDVDALNVGLKLGIDIGNVLAARFGPEDQGYPIKGTGSLAGTVANAMGWLDQLSLALDEADDFSFWIGRDTGSAAKAQGLVGLPNGVQAGHADHVGAVRHVPQDCDIQNERNGSITFAVNDLIVAVQR